MTGSHGTTQLYVSVPYTVERTRTQSVPDKIRTQKTVRMRRTY